MIKNGILVLLITATVLSFTGCITVQLPEGTPPASTPSEENTQVHSIDQTSSTQTEQPSSSKTEKPSSSKTEQSKPVKSQDQKESQTPVSQSNEKSTLSSQASVTPQDAKATALQHAGLSETAVRDLEVELEREKGTLVYEVNFEKDTFDYDYVIDAQTGKILYSQKENDKY